MKLLRHQFWHLLSLMVLLVMLYYFAGEYQIDILAGSL